MFRVLVFIFLGASFSRLSKLAKGSRVLELRFYSGGHFGKFIWAPVGLHVRGKYLQKLPAMMSI